MKGWGVLVAIFVLAFCAGIIYLAAVRIIANSECEDRGGVPVPRSSICLDPDALR